MKTISCTKAMMGMCLFIVAAAPQPQRNSQDYRYTTSTRAAQVYQLPQTPRPKLDVDNVFGSITVTGAAGNAVEFKGVRTVRAVSEAKLKEADNDVRLEVFVDGDTLCMKVNGPFRDEKGNTNWSNVGYIVKYDFELLVPTRTRLALKTVNEGNVSVTGMDEEFAVQNVNGRVTLADMGGWGSAKTVNGPVAAGFKAPPAGDCDFKTVNGDVTLTFNQAPAALFQAKTFNGKILSDFAVTPLPGAPGKGARSGGLCCPPQSALWYDRQFRSLNPVWSTG